MIIISIWLKWYFHLDITPNTLRFSIYPEVAYTKPVKALDNQNQSILIVASISGASLRLRTNTSTLIRILIGTLVILPMGFRGVYPERSCFLTIGKHNLLSHLHKNPILKYMRTMMLRSHNTHKCNTSLFRIIDVQSR